VQEVGYGDLKTLLVARKQRVTVAAAGN
jgi:hypothetical protein